MGRQGTASPDNAVYGAVMTAYALILWAALTILLVGVIV